MTSIICTHTNAADNSLITSHIQRHGTKPFPHHSPVAESHFRQGTPVLMRILIAGNMFTYPRLGTVETQK